MLASENGGHGPQAVCLILIIPPKCLCIAFLPIVKGFGFFFHLQEEAKSINKKIINELLEKFQTRIIDEINNFTSDEIDSHINNVFESEKLTTLEEV